MEITLLHKASELPGSWDDLAEDYFQTRIFLEHTEKYNPCHQRYYLLIENGVLQTGAVVYTLSVNLLTYQSKGMAYKMNIAGIPCSVSSSGIPGNRKYVHNLLNFIASNEKGLLLALNLEPEIIKGRMVKGRTLPSVIFENSFRSWDDYLGSIRAPYRRRIRLLITSGGTLEKKQIPCASFSEKMYRQYLEVLKQSKGKLETLTMDFFQHLPPEFRLAVLHQQEIPAGWFITVHFREKHYFFLGGIDYAKNSTFNTYFNILTEIIREGIEMCASVIDLGQTAEIPKLRTGGKLHEKFMLGTHSNPVFRVLLKSGKRFLEYSAKYDDAHVFKELR
jgi:hypothetical protein